MSAPVGGIVFRPEEAADAAAVRALLLEAFGGPAEAKLVDQLRSAGELVLGLVAVAAAPETIVGYLGFPRLQIETADGPRPAVGLAPLAVASSHQGRGIGATILRVGLDRLIARHEEIVFVLGDPALYGRFGFSADDAREFASPYVGPHFMARRLAAAAPRRGRLRYPAAFDAFG